LDYFKRSKWSWGQTSLCYLISGLLNLRILLIVSCYFSLPVVFLLTGLLRTLFQLYSFGSWTTAFSKFSAYSCFWAWEVWAKLSNCWLTIRFQNWRIRRNRSSFDSIGIAALSKSKGCWPLHIRRRLYSIVLAYCERTGSNPQMRCLEGQPSTGASGYRRDQDCTWVFSYKWSSTASLCRSCKHWRFDWRIVAT
jgi:hypothetical protein